MIKCAIFDLDGTLVNTIDDLALSCEHLIKKYGYEANWSMDDYKDFVGNGARLLVQKAFGDTLSDEVLDERFEEFKLYYDEHKLDHARLYDGIKEQLDILKEKGVKLCVVTNKPHIAAVKMCNHFFGENYFESVCGNQKELPRKPDPTTTLLAMKNCGCVQSHTLYFGDSDVDMQTANNAMINAVGVCWGYRSREVLEKYDTYAIIDDISKISKLF